MNWRRYGRIQSVIIQDVDGVLMGSYICKACQSNYAANKPLSWDQCTPEFCHDCKKDLERVRGLFA